MQSDDETAAKIRQAGPQPLSNASIRACLSRLLNPKTGDPMHITKLAANANIMFLAGYETTSHALTWTLFELAAHQSLQVHHMCCMYLQQSMLNSLPSLAMETQPMHSLELHLNDKHTRACRYPRDRCSLANCPDTFVVPLLMQLAHPDFGLFLHVFSACQWSPFGWLGKKKPVP